MFHIIPFELESAYAITQLLDSSMWAWSMNVSGTWMPVNKNGQIEIFLQFFRSGLLKIEVFYSIFKYICKELFVFFSNFILSFLCWHFPSEKLWGFQSKFRGRKRCSGPENIKLNPKTMKDFSKIFHVAGNFCKNFTKCRQIL